MHMFSHKPPPAATENKKEKLSSDQIKARYNQKMAIIKSHLSSDIKFHEVPPAFNALLSVIENYVIDIQEARIWLESAADYQCPDELSCKTADQKELSATDLIEYLYNSAHHICGLDMMKKGWDHAEPRSFTLRVPTTTEPDLEQRRWLFVEPILDRALCLIDPIKYPFTHKTSNDYYHDVDLNNIFLLDRRWHHKTKY